MPFGTDGQENSANIELCYKDHGAAKPEDFRDDLKQIDVPTLVIQREPTTFGPSRLPECGLPSC
jgi:predicted alpha/beta-hydrolase family hydrolase